MGIELLSFIALSFIIAVTPGPSVVYVVSYSLRYGSKAGIVATLGINAGSIVAILVAAFGLSSLLEKYPDSIVLIQMLGSFYVIYLARAMWPRGRSANADEQSLTEKSYGNLFGNGFITSVLNPKDVLFYTAFIPTFIPQPVEGGSYQSRFLQLAFSYLAIGFITKCSFAVLSGYVKNLLDSRNSTRMNYVSSIMLVALGLFLVAKSMKSLFP
ncbi:MAG: LysE family translocator [Actinobacteria bacterium]|nr:LysE family translocator [Actinomycetota bacterium]